MPTYEYECTKCGHLFERFQPITSKPVSTCPKCRGKVKRLISGGSGLIFRGSGFYITENRSASYKEKARSEGGEAVGGGSVAGGGTGGSPGGKGTSGASGSGGTAGSGGSGGKGGPEGGARKKGGSGGKD